MLQQRWSDLGLEGELGQQGGREFERGTDGNRETAGRLCSNPGCGIPGDGRDPGEGVDGSEAGKSEAAGGGLSVQ